jgi:hypothetical protein
MAASHQLDTMSLFYVESLEEPHTMGVNQADLTKDSHMLTAMFLKSQWRLNSPCRSLHGAGTRMAS